MKLACSKKAMQVKSKRPIALIKFFSDGFIAHDLRLSVNGKVAQIDHIRINQSGFVTLFETKNFSNDVEINNEGVFHFYDHSKKAFRPFPSPVEQSIRHEEVIKEVFQNIGFMPIGFAHFIIFDYKAKITKPPVGFDNVCYPDMLKQTYKKYVDKVSVFDTLKVLGNATKKALQKNTLDSEEALKKIISTFHQPLNVDYKAKFGIQENRVKIEVATEKTNTESSMASQPTETKIENEYDMLTIAKMAKALNIKTKALEGIMIEKGFLSRHEKGYLILNSLGKNSGIKHLKGRAGYYFLIPVSLTVLFK